MQSRLQAFLACFGEVVSSHGSENANLGTAGVCGLCPIGDEMALFYKLPGFKSINKYQTLASMAFRFPKGTCQCNLLWSSFGTRCGYSRHESTHHLRHNGSSDIKYYGWHAPPFLDDHSNDFIPAFKVLKADLCSHDETDPNCFGTNIMILEWCESGMELESPPNVIIQSQSFNLYFNISEGRVPSGQKVIVIIGFPCLTYEELAIRLTVLFEDCQFRNKEDLTGGSSPWTVRQLVLYWGCDALSFNAVCQINKEDQYYGVCLPDSPINESLTSSLFGQMDMSCGILADLTRQWSTGAFKGQGSMRKVMPVLRKKTCGCFYPLQPSCLISGIIISKGDMARHEETGSTLVEFDCKMFQLKGQIFKGCDDFFLLWAACIPKQEAISVWVQRIPIFVSFIGSLAIVVDIINSKKIKSSIYHQIMLGLTASDLCTSIAWALISLRTASYLSAGLFGADKVDTCLPSRSEGVQNHHASVDTFCKAQGFLLHLGFTSILYSMVLSYYYKRSVVDGMRDTNFSSWHRTLLWGAPVLFGTVVAIVAVPFLHQTPFGCIIDSSSHAARGWIAALFLFYMPYGPAYIFVPINSFYMYFRFRGQMNTSRQFRLSDVARANLSSQQGENGAVHHSRTFEDCLSKLTRIGLRWKQDNQGRVESEVFWQAFWYVCGFYASYFMLLLLFVLTGYAKDTYWFYMMISIVAPMQGLCNSFVYFRRRNLPCRRILQEVCQCGVRYILDACRRCWTGIGSQQLITSHPQSKITRTIGPHDHPLANNTHQVSGSALQSALSPLGNGVIEVHQMISGQVQFSSGGLPPSEEMLKTKDSEQVVNEMSFSSSSAASEARINADDQSDDDHNDDDDDSSSPITTRRSSSSSSSSMMVPQPFAFEMMNDPNLANAIFPMAPPSPSREERSKYHHQYYYYEDSEEEEEEEKTEVTAYGGV